MTRVMGTCLTYDVPRVDHRVHGYKTIIRPGALTECLARRTLNVWLNHRRPSRPIAGQTDGTLTFVDSPSELMCLVKIQSPMLGAFLQDVEASGQLSGFSLGGINPLAVRWEGETRIIERADVSELSILVGRPPAFPTTARIVKDAARAA